MNSQKIKGSISYHQSYCKDDRLNGIYKSNNLVAFNAGTWGLSYNYYIVVGSNIKLDENLTYQEKNESVENILCPIKLVI